MFWTLLFHTFARTLCFHALFYTVFWTLRWFIGRNRYFHVLFCLDYMKVNLATWKRENKNGFGLCSDAEPYVFTIILISKFPKPCVFSVVLARFGLAAAQWIAARAAEFSRKACKKIGFWKHEQEKTCENTGFCTRDSPRPRFFLHILVGKKSFHKTFLVHLPFRGASWTPPQLGQKSSVSY